MIPYAFRVRTLSHSTIAFCISLNSILTCRIILNMQGLKTSNAEHVDSSKINASSPSAWYLDTICETVDEIVNRHLQSVDEGEQRNTGGSFTANAEEVIIEERTEHSTPIVEEFTGILVNRS
ncbi:hypothetical protein H0H87_009282 [Tephrocybe sp. NHM501043]|nr:hypothetical protein H0H87_009282 [Tephrocybe sp. NHM501043]